MNPENKEEKLKEEIEKVKLNIREEFEDVKNQHIKRIERKYGKLVDVEKQRERDIISDINSSIEIVKLKAELKGYQAGKQETLKQVEKIIDELKTRNIDDAGLDVETQEYWVNVEELKQKLKEK